MRRLLLLLCLILLALAMPAAAQTDIHHCIGTNGGPVFTDQPCSALNATSVHAPTPSPAQDPAAPEPLPVTCAADVAELRQGVIEAFARHDANRLAGLMLWNGYGRGAAVADITSLDLLMRHSLLDVQASGDEDDSADKAAAAAPPSIGAPTLQGTPATAPSADGLTLRIDGNDDNGDPRVLHFDIVRRAGCLWLRNAD